MRTLAAPEDSRLEELARRAPAQAPLEPSWLGQARRDASAWIEEHGFPNTKDEDWRDLPLDPILGQSFEWSASRGADPSTASRAAEAVEAASLCRSATRLVFVNGRFAPVFSLLGDLPVGTTVSNLAADPERFHLLTARPDAEPTHAFSALNTTLAVDGAFVDLPAGTTLEEPIELIFLTDPGAGPLVSCPRSFIGLGEASRATIVETHGGLGGERYVTNAATHVSLGENAELDHYHLQLESERAYHLSCFEVHQARGSRLGTRLVALGAQIARHEVRVFLDEEGAEASLDGLYLPWGNQHHDHPVLVEHVAPRGTSQQRYVGIVDERGRGVFNGHVVVHQGAAGTDASQSNKNLLLSARAEVDTRPRLEIFADDVACAHGASVGRLDADALFYLRSRGIPERRARGLLVHGFAAQMIERLGIDPLRLGVQKMITARLGLDEVELLASKGPGPARRQPGVAGR